MKTNFNFRKLYSAYLNCRKHKRKTYHSQKFEIHLESEILKLEKELKKRVYHPKKSICFIATKPIIREIFAATFQDRVVHHLLYNFLAKFSVKRE